MISSVFTPKISAAIWAKIVSLPVPRSVAPTSRLKEPSSFSFKLAPPISRYGIAVPCMTMATPIPRFKCGLPATSCHSGFPYLCSQSIACAPSRTHSSSPTVSTISGRGSRPSFQAVLKGWYSPDLKAFLRRKASGSKPKSRAIISICRSTGQKPCGTP